MAVKTSASINTIPLNTASKKNPPLAEIKLKKSHNLNDPILDVSMRVNNPVGRLWLALKKIWSSQKTTVMLKFTIPLLVLPIVLYLGYRIWQGRGVNIPMAKMGVTHLVKINNQDTHVLILPTSDVYVLRYPEGFSGEQIVDKAVIVFGTYNHLTNSLAVENIASYNPQESISLGTGTNTQTAQSALQQLWNSILSFLRLFQ